MRGKRGSSEKKADDSAGDRVPHVQKNFLGISTRTLRRIKEKGVQAILFVAAIWAIVSIFFIFVFLLRDGLVIFERVGLVNFLTATEWSPWKDEPVYGTAPLIVGTLLVTLGAMAFSVPLSVGSAIFISEIAPSKVKKVVKPAIELLSGIPSVVYGFFGLLVMSTWMQDTFDQPSGSAWITASVMLGIMAIPTITSVSEDAISSVPREFKEGSLAMGATRWQTIRKVIVPSSLSGITAGIILGMGRAIGETMAVMMCSGNTPIIPDPIWDVWSPIRTITATLGIETGEVAHGSEWYHALFGLAVILLVITLFVNLSATVILSRIKEKHMGAERKTGAMGAAIERLPDNFKRRGRQALLILLLLMLVWFIYLSLGLMTLVAGISIGALAYVLRRRVTAKWAQRIAFSILMAAVLIVIFILGSILYYIIFNGLPALSWEFVSESPRDLGREGGIFPAIMGTLYLVAGAILFALPIGIGAAIYLTEYTREGKLTKVIRSGVDLLNSTPSIVFGLFGLAFLVLYLDFGISMLAGQIALGLMILPTIIRTTEESLKSVPQSVREGSLALGATKWQTIRKVVLPPATPGVVTGTILSIGRAAGETAPIMFTAVVFSQRYLPNDVLDPVMALPFHLFVLATNVPGAKENQYGTALVLLILVVSIYMIAILFRNYSLKKMRW